MKQKLYIVILCLFIAGKLLAYSGGSGTSGDPYQIATAADLVALSQTAASADWNKYFIQTADIDASGISNFEPIGYYYNYPSFEGEYDGDGHVIDGLSISIAHDGYVGMFAYLLGTVKNLGITNAVVSGTETDKIGIVAGRLDGTVNNVYTTGTVTGPTATWAYAGGLGGYSSGGTFTNSYSLASVTARGGGGLVGYCWSGLTMTNCYAAGAVSATEHHGGLLGYANNVAATSSYWDTETTGQSTAAGDGTNPTGATGLTTAQMQDQVSYSGWDFISTWSIDGSHNDAYPFLAWQTFPPATIYANSSTGNDATGDGTSDSPYQSFHKAYTMAADADIIDLTGTFDWTNGTGEDGDAANTGYTLAKELTIRGQGMANTFIQANSSLASADRSVFYTSMSSGTVTLEDLTVRYGDSKHPAYGGGITATYGSASDQVLVLNRVKVTECSTYEGGGIKVKYSSLQLNQSEVSNCIATSSMTGGGGISAYQSVVTLTQSTVSGNAATVFGGDGGGIYALNGCNVTLTESTVSNNSAEVTDGGIGGGIYFQGSLLTITKSTVSGNAAGGSGGIALWDGTFSMVNSTISENTATNAIGGIAMYATTGTIVNSTIANNSAPSRPGIHIANGDLEVRNSIIANNSDGAGSLDYSFDNSYYSPTLTDGGYNVVGVSNVAANATGGFNNATSILYNTKYNDAGTAYTSWSQGGTVLANQNLNLAATVADNGGPTQTLALTSGSFAIGAGVAVEGITTDQRGTDRLNPPTIGAYEFIAPPRIPIIYANSSTGSDATGDGSEANPYQSFHKAYTMAIAGDTLNLTGTFDWTNGTGEDGDVANHGYPIEKALTIRGQGMNSTFIQADASLETVDRRVFLIYNVSGTVTMEDLSIRYGGTTYGGGIYIDSDTGDPSLLLNRVKISDCDAVQGGGIYVDRYSSLQLNSSEISDCVAAEQGGGIYVDKYSSLQLNSSEISGCEAFDNDYAGGGLYVYEYATAVITQSVISGNNAVGDSGGIHSQYADSISIIETTISGNTAGGDAGGCTIFADNFTMVNSTISENSATDYIGGIATGHNIAGTIENSTIANNSGLIVGGLYANYGNLIVRNTIIANNTSVEGSYDYYYGNHSLTDNGYNIVGVSTVAANAEGGFNHATSILYNTKYNDAGTAYTSWSQGGVELANQNLNLAATVADNGGPTQTLALTTGSFAAGSATTGIPYGTAPYWNNSPDADQRGVERTVGQNTSIGAYSGNYSPTYTWTGASSTAWNTLANWDLNAVPTGTDNVVIANVTNNPAITTGTGASCNNLTVNSGASLIVNSGGSLITNGSITNNGTISMEQSISDGTWHLISVPNDNTTANTFLGDYLQYWTENGQSWTDIADPATTLTPVQGYSLWGVAKNTTYTFTGTPNTGAQSFTLSYHNNASGTADGMNLVGNPYPSSIDWATLQPTYGAAYIWNPSTTNYVVNTADDIAPMQGFFIYTSTDGNTFSLANTNRSHGGSFYKRGSSLSNGLVLQASYQSYFDELRLEFDDNATEGFILQDDAWKLLSGYEGVSQLWSVCPDGMLAIDTRPWQETIQLGFTNDVAGIYTIGVSEMADITTAVLEDTKLNFFHDLTKGAYAFAWDLTDDENRFKLHLGVTGIENLHQQNNNLLMYASGQTIYLKTIEGRASGLFTMTDMSGRILMHKELDFSGLMTIPVNVKPGVYVVSLTSDVSSAIKKVVIQ